MYRLDMYPGASERERDRDRRTDRQTDRQTDRDKDRETDRDREVERAGVAVTGSSVLPDYTDNRECKAAF